jgi:hypothetical protein
MIDDSQRALAETVFEREQQRDREIGGAMRIEEARRSAAIANMGRLRALRLAREAKAKNE